MWCRLDERNGRVLAIGVLDNLVKGAAGQADPGVQRRPRPARDGRPAAAAARAVTLATDPLLVPVADDLPRVDRAARLPAGFAAAGATAGIKASGRPDLVLIVRRGRARCRPRRCSRPTGSRPRPCSSPGRTSRPPAAGPRPPATRGPSSPPRAARTPRPGPRATPTRRRSGRRSRAPSMRPEAQILHLSTGIIGTRLPVDLVTAGIGGSSTAAWRRPMRRSSRRRPRCARRTRRPRSRPRR